MKKILLTLLVLALFAAGALTFFILTFEVDKYRPDIVRQIQTVFGQPVEIKKITLGWHDGVALSVKELRIFDGQGEAASPFFKVEEAAASVNFRSLLGGRIEVSSIQIEAPFIRIVRNKDGSLKGLEKMMSGQNASGGAPSAVLAGALLVNKVELLNGTVIFKDLMAPEPFEIALDQVDVRLRDVGIERSIPVEIKAATFSGSQNVSFETVVKYSLVHQIFTLTDGEGTLNLESLDQARVLRSLPQIKPADFPDPFRGQLLLKLQSFKAGPKGSEMTPLVLSLKKGALGVTGLAPVEDAELALNLTADKAVLERFSALFAEGTLAASGETRLSGADSKTTFRFTGKGIKASRLVPPDPRQPVTLSGLLGVSLEGAASGLEADRIQQTLSTQGKLFLKEGVIQNFNLVREILSKLSIIPGMQQRFQQRLPPEYLQKVNQKDTPLESLELPFSIQNSRLSMPMIAVTSENFSLSGALNMSLAGGLAGRLMVRLDPYFSAALIRAVQELQYLTTASGEIEIPVGVSGTTAKPVVLPDLQYIGSRLATAKTQELIGSFLQKKNPSQPPADAAEAQDNSAPVPASAPSKQANAEAIFGQLLQTVLGSQTGSSSSSNSGNS